MEPNEVADGIQTGEAVQREAILAAVDDTGDVVVALTGSGLKG